jgi:hypothetical protein
MKETRTWYTFKEVKVSGGKTWYFTPWSDLFIFDEPFDYLFDTPEEAWECFHGYFINDGNKPADWTLCEVTIKPV